MALKDKIADLISNINSCQTISGVDELEKYYDQKKQEYPDISPMMDIMVRDAVTGRREELVAADEEEEYQKAERDIKAKELGMPAKKDKKEPKETPTNEVQVISMLEFKKSLRQCDESAINVAAFTYGAMNPPSPQHHEVLDALETVAETLGAMPFVFTKSLCEPAFNPLTLEQKCDILEDRYPDLAVCHDGYSTMLKVTKRLQEQGITDLYFVIQEGDIDYAKRAGRYFLKENNSFTIITVPMISDVTSYDLRRMVREGEFVEFIEATGSDALLYGKLEEGMFL